ncbi:hypothetical protein Taro_050197 [Colocasia esculenta]|uniref:Uncharacterized protein n=1 Tax=Colocasia esculenta TaxID=4460 RepID=A0A843XCU9_COLES|nr:hypothetical protein [Colocasia esculenta]
MYVHRSVLFEKNKLQTTNWLASNSDGSLSKFGYLLDTLDADFTDVCRNDSDPSLIISLYLCVRLQCGRHLRLWLQLQMYNQITCRCPAFAFASTLSFICASRCIIKSLAGTQPLPSPPAQPLPPTPIVSSGESDRYHTHEDGTEEDAQE